MGDEIYQLIMQFISNDKQATEWHEEGKISFDSALKMKSSNAENFTKVLNELSKFTANDE